MKLNTKDLFLRFILGGSAVAACYILLQLIPWKSFAGIFAAFPAVMIAAVIMAGISKGSSYAAEVAMGAVAGMLGCTICVIVAMLFMAYFNTWFIAILFSILAWLISSTLFIIFIQRLLEKSKKNYKKLEE